MVWKKGKSGNPGGRSSTQQRLSQTFYPHVYQAWLKNGPKCLEEMAQNHPVDFVRLVAGLMPKQIHAEINKTEIKTAMSLTEVLGELEALSKRLGYEITPRQLPHNSKTLDSPIPRLPLNSNGEA